MNLDEINKEIEEVQRALLKIGLEKEKILRDSQLSTFIPNPKQLLFLEHAGVKLRGGFCGNRFGKSTIGVVEDSSWLLGERPFFPVGHPLRRLGIPSHGVKGLVIGEDWDKVREIFTEDNNKDRPGKFFQFLPSASVSRTTRNEKSVINMIEVQNTVDGRDRTSTVFFDTVRSFMSNPKSFESSDWDFIHVDEPIPQPLWKAVSRGLIDRGGKAWWLLTALTEPWMFEDMLENSAKMPKHFWFFEATMDDNPTLSEEDKLIYLAQLTEEERECRRLGKPLAHGRLVFGKYSEVRHLWKKKDSSDNPVPPIGWADWSSPPSDWMCVCAIDPHPQTPHAVLFAAVSPIGDVIVYDEIFDRCLISELAVQIKLRAKKHKMSYFLCDPTAWVRNPDTGRCWADTFFAMKLPIQQGSKEKTAGIIQVNELLGSSRNLWVAPHLVRFRREIRTWYFDKDNKPVDKDDHMMENFRRLVQHEELKYREPQPDIEEFSLGLSYDEFETLNFQIAGLGRDSNYAIH